MNNYYEMLKVAPNASHTEIETCLDDQYTKWRALVTHHDPNIVTQANQALSILEDIRATLLDQDNRNAYDKQLAQEQEKLSGLTDPDMVLAQNPMQPAMAPPRQRSSTASIPRNAEIDRTDAWICTDPKCRKANQIGTQFCSKCGKRIGAECPSCGVLVELSNKFCSNCGVDKEKNFKLKQGKMVKDLQDQINNLKQEIQTGETDYKTFVKEHPHIKEAGGTPPGCVATVIFLDMLLFISFISIANESWSTFFTLSFSALFLIIGIWALVGKNRQIKGVSDMISTQLKPQMKNLEQQIIAIKNQRYGDNMELILKSNSVQDYNDLDNPS